jgi:hypothetical protein
MRVPWIWRAALCIATVGGARAATAQQPAACAFDRCGLIVVSPSVLLAAPVDSGPPRAITWYFVPHVPELDAATGPAFDQYRAAQRHYRGAAIPSAVGIPAILGVVLFASTDPDKRPWGTRAEGGVVGVAIGAVLLGAPLEARAAERLSRAAWLYSRPADPTPRSADGCSYDRCALRFRYRTWSASLVQGLDGRRVAAPRELFAQAGDSARAHYERYLQLRRGNRWRGPLLLTAVVGGLAAGHSRDATVRGVGIGLLGVGYAAGHLSLGSAFQERDELQTAIWLYNRDLAAPR